MASERVPTHKLNSQALAERVKDRWDAGDRALLEHRRNYWLNLAFYQGHQWLEWDSSARVARVRTDVDAGSTRVMTTVNKIQPRLDGLVGRLAQSDLTFEVPPTSSDDSTIAGARLAEQVLSAEHDDADWEWVRLEALYHAFFGGTSAVGVEWDPRGKPGLTDNDQVVNAGSVVLRPLAITDFTIQPGSRRWHDSTWWVSCIALPPEQADDHYRLGYVPSADSQSAHSALQSQLLRERGISSDVPLVNVYTMYERPCPGNGNSGIVCVVIGGKVVRKVAWPFPFTDLNLQVFRQKPLPGVWTGTTMLNAARNPQVLYNSVRSIIAEHTKMAGNARMLVPVGSLDPEIDLTDEAGEVIPYWPGDGGQQPHYMQPADLPRYVYAEPENLERELDDIMSTNEVARGVAPGDRNSGLALSILAERNDTPLGTMARNQAAGWSRIAQLALRLYEAKVQDQRSATVWVDDVPRQIHWTGEALRGQWRAKVPLEATAPTSKAAWFAQLVSLKQNFPEVFEGVPGTALVSLLDMPGTSAISRVVDADARRAQKENELVMSGEVVFPAEYDDHARHIAEHNRMRKSDSYLYATDEVRAVLDDHVLAHQRLVEEEAASQAALNAVQPGLAALPQANEPIGSAVPPDVDEMQRVAM